MSEIKPTAAHLFYSPEAEHRSPMLGKIFLAIIAIGVAVLIGLSVWLILL